MRWVDVIIDSMGMSLSKLWQTVKDREAWHSWGRKESDMTEQLKNNLGRGSNSESQRPRPCRTHLQWERQTGSRWLLEKRNRRPGQWEIPAEERRPGRSSPSWPEHGSAGGGGSVKDAGQNSPQREPQVQGPRGRRPSSPGAGRLPWGQRAGPQEGGSLERQGGLKVPVRTRAPTSRGLGQGTFPADREWVIRGQTNIVCSPPALRA